MNERLAAYGAGREAFLATIVETLAADERVVAAWLTGSYARGTVDDVSDIDLTIVIADDHAPALCRQTERVTAWPPAERLHLFSQFGRLANVHENNDNAPPGGTFTAVLYHPSAQPAGVMVDWTLVPYAAARLPDPARVLFEHRPVTLALPPESPDPAALAARVGEQVAFFWMMMAVTSKYLIRDDLSFVHCWLGQLRGLVLSVEGLLNDKPWPYRRDAVRPAPATTAAELAAALARLADEMEALMAGAGRRGLALRPAPREAIDALLRLRPSYSPDELLAAITPENMHEEVDWGAPAGKGRGRA